MAARAASVFRQFNRLSAQNADAMAPYVPNRGLAKRSTFGRGLRLPVRRPCAGLAAEIPVLQSAGPVVFAGADQSAPRPADRPAPASVPALDASSGSF